MSQDDSSSFYKKLDPMKFKETGRTAETEVHLEIITAV